MQGPSLYIYKPFTKCVKEFSDSGLLTFCIKIQIQLDFGLQGPVSDTFSFFSLYKGVRNWLFLTMRAYDLMRILKSWALIVDTYNFGVKL